MPPELRPALGEKEYSERMCTLTRLLGRYSWSNMMRIYTALVFALTLLVVRPNLKPAHANTIC